MSERPAAEYRDPQVYVERFGIGVNKFAETLANPPERPLDESERQAFFSIDAALAEGRYATAKDDLIQAEIEGWDDTTQPSINIILDYFETEEGQSELAELEHRSGIVAPDTQPQHAQVAAARRIATIMSQHEGDHEWEESIKSLAANSHEYRVRQLQSDEIPPDPAHVYLYPEPAHVIAQAEKLQAMRDFLRSSRQDLLQRTDLTPNVRDALLVEIDGYRQRATDLLGKIYPAFVNIYHQALLVDDVESLQGYTHTMLQSLRNTKSSIYLLAESIITEENSDLETRFSHTMDRWRNGVVMAEEDIPFSAELLELEEVLEAETAESQREPGAFTPEEIAYLDTLDFDAEATADMFRYFLERNNLLSIDTAEDFKPGNWPSDSSQAEPKIGVIVGEYTNLRYSNGWLYVPRRTKRKLRQRTPSGTAFVVPHELEHAIDGITAQYGDQQVGLARPTARLSNAVREGIGKQAENQVAQQLFGQSLAPSLNYVKALRRLDETGSETAASLAFAEQAATENGLDQPNNERLIKTAENRVQRLIGLRGRNTQALAYIEQELLARALTEVPDSVQDIIAANSALDIRMQVRLHEFGLLSTNRYQPEVPPVQAVEEYLRNMLEQRVSA